MFFGVSARSWLFAFFCIALVQGDLFKRRPIYWSLLHMCVVGMVVLVDWNLLCGSVWFVVGIWWGLMELV